ncbi:MAG: hypothetical protein WA961_04710 [Rhodanobacter sp.]
MKRAFRLRPQTRCRLAWLVVLLLSWQQVAVAAYACVGVPTSAGTAAVAVAAHSSSMAAMGDRCEEMPAAPVDPLCRQHCQPDHATQVDARNASVPASTLAALPPQSPSVAAVALSSQRTLARRDRLQAPPPIPRLLFCSLLI